MTASGVTELLGNCGGSAGAGGVSGWSARSAGGSFSPSVSGGGVVVGLGEGAVVGTVEGKVVGTGDVVGSGKAVVLAEGSGGSKAALRLTGTKLPTIAINNSNEQRRK